MVPIEGLSVSGISSELFSSEDFLFEVSPLQYPQWSMFVVSGEGSPARCSGIFRFSRRLVHHRPVTWIVVRNGGLQ